MTIPSSLSRPKLATRILLFKGTLKWLVICRYVKEGATLTLKIMSKILAEPYLSFTQLIVTSYNWLWRLIVTKLSWQWCWIEAT